MAWKIPMTVVNLDPNVASAVERMRQKMAADKINQRQSAEHSKASTWSGTASSTEEEWALCPNDAYHDWVITEESM